jgi:hypothetical protein
MRRVIVESPFAGDVALNIRYARACMRDCLLRGEAPFASHLLYPQPGVLNDDDPDDRRLGIQAGFFWKMVAAATVVYTDLGITDGMRKGIDVCAGSDHPVEYRQLGPGWEERMAYKTRWEEPSMANPIAACMDCGILYDAATEGHANQCTRCFVKDKLG